MAAHTSYRLLPLLFKLSGANNLFKRLMLETALYMEIQNGSDQQSCFLHSTLCARDECGLDSLRS